MAITTDKNYKSFRILNGAKVSAKVMVSIIVRLMQADYADITYSIIDTLLISHRA